MTAQTMPGGRSMNKMLASIFLVVFIDLLGFSLILPLLPYYAKTFQATDLQVGLLAAVYAAAQLISAPLLGRLSDRFGRRPMLIFSILGNTLSFLLLGAANSLALLFISRILAGATAGNISVAQAYITDVTDAKSRARGLGLLGAAFGLGFIIGPVAGGALSAFGYPVPAFTAAALGVINLALVLLWLPESLSPQRRAEMALSKNTPFTISAMFAALRRPLVGPLLHTRFFFGLGFSLFQTIFSLYALERFHLSAQQTGYILAYVGVLSVLTQGVAIGKLTARFSDRSLIFYATLTMAAGLIGWALAPSVIVLLVVMAPIAASGGVLNTVINSAISKSTPPIEVGGMLGIAASLEALTRVIAPSLGGLLLDQVSRRYGAWTGTAVPGLFAGLLLAWLATYIYRHVSANALEPAAQISKV